MGKNLRLVRSDCRLHKFTAFRSPSSFAASFNSRYQSLGSLHSLSPIRVVAKFIILSIGISELVQIENCPAHLDQRVML
jgi:hypothetical protein